MLLKMQIHCKQTWASSWIAGSVIWSVWKIGKPEKQKTDKEITRGTGQEIDRSRDRHTDRDRDRGRDRGREADRDRLADRDRGRPRYPLTEREKRELERWLLILGNFVKWIISCLPKPNNWPAVYSINWFQCKEGASHCLGSVSAAWAHIVLFSPATNSPIVSMIQLFTFNIPSTAKWPLAQRLEMTINRMNFT